MFWEAGLIGQVLYLEVGLPTGATLKAAASLDVPVQSLWQVAVVWNTAGLRAVAAPAQNIKWPGPAVPDGGISRVGGCATMSIIRRSVTLEIAHRQRVISPGRPVRRPDRHQGSRRRPAPAKEQEP